MGIARIHLVNLLENEDSSRSNHVSLCAVSLMKLLVAVPAEYDGGVPVAMLRRAHDFE